MTAPLSISRCAPILWTALLLGAAACNEIEGIRAGLLTGPGGAGGGTTTAGGGGMASTSNGTGGTGAETASGATGGMGGTPSTGGAGGSTTTTTTPQGPELECNYPATSSCAAGQVCCLDKKDPYEDKCAAPGTCNPPSEYGQAECSSDAHCDTGMHCCLYILPDPMNPQYYNVVAIYCDTECSVADDEIPACTGDVDCLGSSPYVSCKAVLGYPTYEFCQVP